MSEVEAVELAEGVDDALLVAVDDTGSVRDKVGSEDRLELCEGVEVAERAEAVASLLREGDRRLKLDDGVSEATIVIVAEFVSLRDERTVDEALSLSVAVSVEVADAVAEIDSVSEDDDVCEGVIEPIEMEAVVDGVPALNVRVGLAVVVGDLVVVVETDRVNDRSSVKLGLLIDRDAVDVIEGLLREAVAENLVGSLDGVPRERDEVNVTDTVIEGVAEADRAVFVVSSENDSVSVRWVRL